ncbi:hypothetical protein [Dyella sp.]|uniref:hypothetical protein n=1 Tax=Dyella sp. TaxID=1869338 RepID=UPI002ED1815D
MDLKSLIPHMPITPRVAINNEIIIPIVADDFSAFGLVGINGSPINLFMAGIDASFYQVKKGIDSLSIVLRNKDVIVFSFEDASSREGLCSIEDFNRFVGERERKRDVAIEESKSFLGWRFLVELSDCPLQSMTSMPFEMIQSIFSWGPGAADAKFRAEAITGNSDGTTKGKVWLETELSRGASFKITIEGVQEGDLL